MSVHDWLLAFLLTQGIEVPVYLWTARWLARSLSGPRRFAYAAGASAITHPIIWFCLPWETVPYPPLLVAAEAFAVAVEAVWGKLCGAPRPWLASLIANIASCSVGGVTWWSLGRG
jgi:hypothetical protein